MTSETLATILAIVLLIINAPYIFKMFVKGEKENELSDTQVLLDLPITDIIIHDNQIFIIYKPQNKANEKVNN